jgi:hypothetical protein
VDLEQRLARLQLAVQDGLAQELIGTGRQRYRLLHGEYAVYT